MRLPSRGFLAGIGFSFAGWAFGQAPPPPPPPAVGGRVTVTAQEPKSVTRVEPASAAVSSETAPQPVGFESDIYCFGYVGDLNEGFPFEVDGAENIAEQVDFTTGD